ncbi:MAG: MATE family efflux transporter [Clostridium sp.]|nr:MATE family efflux transporter [Clostridium sp.]
MWYRIKNDAEFYKKLGSLVLPIAFQNFMLALVSASDAFMLGALNQNSLSAVSLAGQIQFVQNLILAALTIGMTVLAAQYWGKGDKESVEKIFAYVMKISVASSFLFFLGALVMPDMLMRIFTSDSELIDLGTGYLRVVALSYMLTGISQIYLCIMKNCEQAFKSTLISMASVILNIIFNALLIFGLCGMPEMGIAGAALATVIARIVEVLFVVIESLRKDHMKLNFSYILRNDKQLKKDYWKYTWPVLGNELVWGCGFTMYSVIMGHLGTDAVAANSIANIVKNLIACFCIGIGSGGGILVGNELGGGRLETAKEYGDKLVIISIICGAVSGIVLLALTPLIAGFSNLSLEAHEYLIGMLVMCTYYMIGKAINSTVIAGIFCAGGDSKFGFICDTITLWCVTVPIGLAAAFILKWPILVVYFIVNMDEIIKLPAVYKNYKKYNWVRNLTRETI